MLSDEAAALLFNDKELTNEEISGLFDDCSGGIEADVFTYGGRTLILAHAGEPLRSRFSAQMRVKKKKPHTIKCAAKSYVSDRYFL